MLNPMRKQRGCLSALVLLIGLRLLATGDSLNYLLPTDSLVLQMDYGGELVFEHQIEPGQTLFSVSKFFTFCKPGSGPFICRKSDCSIFIMPLSRVDTHAISLLS